MAIRITVRCLERRTVVSLPAFGDGTDTYEEVEFLAADLEYPDGVCSWRPLGKVFSVTTHNCADIGKFEVGKFYHLDCAPIAAPAPIPEAARDGKGGL